jgi:hypothetical protein
VVTQGIGWETFNSTDENMEVLINAEQVSIAADMSGRQETTGLPALVSDTPATALVWDRRQQVATMPPPVASQ